MRGDILTPDASKATVLPGTAPGSPDSLPLTVEVNLDWKGRKEIPVVASDEIYVKRTKQVALDAVCQWANSNHLPAVYYSQPGGDNELLIMDTNQVEINVSKHHIHYPKPTADIDAMHQSGMQYEATCRGDAPCKTAPSAAWNASLAWKIKWQEKCDATN